MFKKKKKKFKCWPYPGTLPKHKRVRVLRAFKKAQARHILHQKRELYRLKQKAKTAETEEARLLSVKKENDRSITELKDVYKDSLIAIKNMTAEMHSLGCKFEDVCDTAADQVNHIMESKTDTIRGDITSLTDFCVFRDTQLRYPNANGGDCAEVAMVKAESRLCCDELPADNDYGEFGIIRTGQWH